LIVLAEGVSLPRPILAVLARLRLSRLAIRDKLRQGLAVARLRFEAREGRTVLAILAIWRVQRGS
jgi:hypothetical protein